MRQSQKDEGRRLARHFYGWVVLPMADAPRLEQRLRAILAGGSVAKLTAQQWRRACWSAAVAALLLAGGAAAIRPVAARRAGPNAVVKASPNEVDLSTRRESGKSRNYINSLPPNPRWTRSAFGGKVSLELVGVSLRRDGKLKPPYGNDPYDGFPLDANDAHRILTKSWNPDGALYPQPLYLAGIHFTNGIPNWRVVEYALRVRSKGVSDFDFADYMFESTRDMDDFQPSDGIWRAYEMVEPEKRKEHVTLRICGGAYPWHTDLFANIGSDDAPGTSTATSLGGKEVQVHLTGPIYNAKGYYGYVVACSALPYDVRVVAVDKAGKEFPMSEGTRDIGVGEHHITAFFDPHDLPKARVDMIRLEARPFETVDFGEVALYPAKGAGR